MKMNLYFSLTLAGLSLMLAPVNSWSQEVNCLSRSINPNTELRECPDTAQSSSALPVTIVPWADVTSHLDASEVVILCLVGSYDPSKPSELGPEDSTPAQVLENYLTEIRNLGYNMGHEVTDNVDYSETIKIFIVEGGEENIHEPTRQKALQLHTRFGIQDYDWSIPVIYVFHKSQFIEVYTYLQYPGENGSELKRLVVDLLNPE